MITFTHTNFSNPDFIRLIAELDKEFVVRYPFLKDVTVSFNVLNDAARVIIAYENRKSVACGAFRPVSETAMEIKRMYTLPSYRNQGIGKKILLELEMWAMKEGFCISILETGIHQPEALAAYQKSGYIRIANFAPYKNMKESICMRKDLTQYYKQI